MRNPKNIITSTPLKLDLGIPQLLKEWKELFNPKYLRQDVVAGFSVACIAIPLSLAIALASGVEPALGLTSAVVAGIVCALFGAAPLAVSGPAAAMAVLLATITQKFGLGGLLFVGCGAGFLQIVTGALGAGRFARLVPAPVIMGFVAAIGAIILIGQLPRALGLTPPDQAHVIHVLRDIGEEIKNTNIKDLLIVLSTLALIFILPKVSRRIPAELIAVIVPSVALALLGFNEETIAQIPRTWPAPKLPQAPAGDYFEILTAIFMVYVVASLKTLLTASAIDKISDKPQNYDPDQELIGQGMGNIATTFFGGLPVASVITRSTLNVQSGAKTRRAAITQALILAGLVMAFSPLISKIPVAVLAGVLLSVALKMLNPKEFLNLWKANRVEAYIYLVTFLTMICLDLMVGVQAGIVAALLIAAVRSGRIKMRFHSPVDLGPYRLAIEGALTFMSAAQLAKFNVQLNSLEPERGIIIDFTKVSSIDASGAEQIVALVAQLKSIGYKVALQGVSPICQKILAGSDPQKLLNGNFTVTDSDVAKLLAHAPSPIDRLRYGVEGFRDGLAPYHSQLFSRLANQQSPHILFITCADSRIDPNLITSTNPGELFVVRNVGNIIPRYNKSMVSSEAAAIEFAVSILGVKEIVVCGHSGCGAMKAILSNGDFSEYGCLSNWLAVAEDVQFEANINSADDAARRNAFLQIQNLQTYAVVSRKVKNGELRLRAWFYDIGRAELENWDPHAEKFIPLLESSLDPIKYSSAPRASVEL